MTFENVGPIAVHRSHGIAELSIFCVCRQMHAEVVAAWQRVAETTLYIQVVLDLDILAQIKEKEMEAALEAAVSRNSFYTAPSRNPFYTAPSCLIDIRLLQTNDVNRNGNYNFGKRVPPDLTTYLEHASRSIASALSQMPAMTKIEVAWNPCVRPGPREAIERTLRPLRNLGLQLIFLEGDTTRYSRFKHILHSSRKKRRSSPNRMVLYQMLRLSRDTDKVQQRTLGRLFGQSD